MTFRNGTAIPARAIAARGIRVCAAGVILLQAACGAESTSPPKDNIPASLTASATDTLRGVVASALSTPVSVIVKNKAGEPVSGIGVTFQVASGGGTFSVPAATTDASGRAATSWVLGQRTGVQQATATVGSLPAAIFVAVAGAAPAASIVKLAGDAQTATVASVLATAPSVSVKDEFGNSVVDATVTFTVTAGGGTLGATTARTNATGTATVAWTLGTRSGTQTLSAAVGSLTPIAFTATATPDVPASLRITPTDPIVIGVGYSQQISASALDRFGNATNTPVNLSVASGGGFFTLSTTGLASGIAPGSGSVVATAGSLSAMQTLSIVDPWSRIMLAGRPYGIATSGSTIFATLLDAASVARLQVSPFATAGTIAVGRTPTDVAVNAAGTMALVTNQFDGSVGLIDVQAAQQMRTLNGAGSTFRVIVSSDGTRAYATQSLGQLLAIDLVTGTSIGLIPIPPNSNGLAMGSGDTLVYVSSIGGNITVVNVRQNVVARTIVLSAFLQDIVVSPDGSTLYVASESSSRIEVISLASGTVISEFSVTFGSFGLKLAPDGRTLYVTHPSAGRVDAIDRQTGVITRRFAVGGTPRRISFDRATGRAIVTNEDGWIDYLFLP